MSERALRILVGTVAGLFLLWLAITFIPRGGGGSGASGQAVAEWFQDSGPESVTAVRVQDPGEDGTLELARTGDQWTVNGFRADSATLERFWGTLADVAVEDLVATNPANHARMGVSQDSALVLELDTPDGSRSILVGDAGSRYGTTYARLPGEDEVYLLSGGLRPHLTRSVDDWRNKRVVSVDTAGVGRVEVEREDGGFAVTRSDTLWVLEDGAEADANAVRGILGELARLEATGFYAAGDSLSAQGAVVRVMDGQGEVQSVLQVGSGDGDRWLRREGDSIVYRVPSWRMDRLLPELEAVSGGG